MMVKRIPFVGLVALALAFLSPTSPEAQNQDYKGWRDSRWRPGQLEIRPPDPNHQGERQPPLGGVVLSDAGQQRGTSSIRSSWTM